MDEGDIQLIACNCCGRNFRQDVLKKHEPICIKSNKKQRKVFDSGKQRAQGSDIPAGKTLKPGEIPKPDPKLAMAEAKTKQWRVKHEQLVNSFRAARNYAVAKSTGAPLPPPPPPVVDTSLVQCPYCQRRFNEEASSRHIPFCKDQQAKLAPRVGAAKKSVYKAPPLKTKQPTPVQKSSSTSYSSNGYGKSVVLKEEIVTRPEPKLQYRAPKTNSQSSMPPQTSMTRSGQSSNLPVKTTKSSLPTRTNIARPQPVMSTGTNQSQGTGSYGSAGPRSIAKMSTPPVTNSTTKTAIRKPMTNTNAKSTGFCHECGASFTVSTARFCSECGVRRLVV